VDLNSTNATPPYADWPTAATNIQDAVDAAVAGDQITVTNGTYYPVVANKSAISIRSVNGPESTIIDASESGRCVNFSKSGSLSGFTLTHGSAGGLGQGGGAISTISRGQGVGVLANCILVGNSAAYGGGAAYCTLNDCTLSGNSGTYGGGVAYCTLNNCTLSGNSAYSTINDEASGGGAYDCTLNNCTLIGNHAINSNPPYNRDAYGGGAYASTLNGCKLAGNAASYSGGGAVSCSFNNCTLTGNSALEGGGTSDGMLNNCIVYFNSAAYNENFSFDTLNYCCTMPLPTNGVGNVTSDPLFVDTNGWADLRLQSNSPCINAGNNAYALAGADLDGNPRVVGGTVDIGAYEYQSLSLINFNVVSNQAGFNITGQSNQVVILETSSDLVNWSPFATNILNGHPFPFSDPTPTSLPQRFYRAQAQ
jgi:hypothetical protein